VVERLKSEGLLSEADWRPFFLRPDMPAEGMAVSPETRARRAAGSARLRQMAQTAGLNFVESDHIPNSRRALEASEYARTQGQHEAFQAVVFRKYFGEGQDIGTWAVLRAAAEEVGLDAEAMQAETDADHLRATLDAQIAQAYAIGVNAVPTYVINDRYAVVGAQPYEVFKQAFARIGTLDKAEGR